MKHFSFVSVWSKLKAGGEEEEGEDEDEDENEDWWFWDSGLTGRGGELLGLRHTEQIRSLTATRVQSFVPGEGGAGDELVAGVSFWTGEQVLAAGFCRDPETRRPPR